MKRTGESTTLTDKPDETLSFDQSATACSFTAKHVQAAPPGGKRMRTQGNSSLHAPVSEKGKEGRPKSPDLHCAEGQSINEFHAFLELASSSKLFALLLRASSFFDGMAIASVFMLLFRAGILSTMPVGVGDRKQREIAVAIAFMLTLKIDEEALDRCVEKLLWNILASFLSFGVVPPLCRSRKVESFYYTKNELLDQTRKLLIDAERAFLSKIKWRTHVSFLQRRLVLEQMAQTSKGNVLAHRQRAVPEESVSLECAKAAPFASGQMQVFLSDTNEEGERTWQSLTDILTLLFDTRRLLPHELMTTRKPHRLRKSRHDGDDKTFIFTELIVEAEKPVSSSAATASATKCVAIKNPFLAHMAQQTSIESSCAWFQKSRTHMASHSEE